ncbi:TPA: DEAD/DEAH box helicase family protein, partial [Pseudomonas aeruginosa]
MNAQTQPAALAASSLNINLTDFIDEFGDELLESLNRSNPPVYTGSDNAHRQLVMDRLKRKPFAAQAEVVQAITALLLDRNEQAGIINAEMGTGKTMMAIAVAAVMHAA